MTDTAEFWSGDFGNQYTQRNKVNWEDRKAFWEDILVCTMPQSVLEVGCNKGHNLLAIRDIAPKAFLHGVDVNEHALRIAMADGLHVSKCEAVDVGRRFSGYEMVFTAGLMIHISPAELSMVMQSLIAASSKYVVMIEYHAFEEEEISYRGHADRLWKRPYGDLMIYHGLELADHGHAGPGFDNCHYWVGMKADG